jgi:hypothetical protein
MFYTLNFNILIMGDSQLTWPSYGPPSHVSNHAIPDSVYLLNANLQPQPELVRFWCIGCLVAFNTQSKADPDGTLDSFVKVLRYDLFCKRKGGGNTGACGLCLSSHSSCEMVCFLFFPVG